MELEAKIGDMLQDVSAGTFDFKHEDMTQMLFNVPQAVWQSYEKRSDKLQEVLVKESAVIDCMAILEKLKEIVTANKTELWRFQKWESLIGAYNH